MINRSKDFKDMTVDEMLELYRNNKTVTKRLENDKRVLVENGLEYTTLRERLKMRHKLQFNIGRTARYLKQGLSYEEIAEKLDVNIYDVMKLADIIREAEKRRVLCEERRKAIEEAMR